MIKTTLSDPSDDGMCTYSIRVEWWRWRLVGLNGLGLGGLGAAGVVATGIHVVHGLV